MLAPTTTLLLQLVPAGRRLDFDRAAGHYAYVYRRYYHRPWECIAHNAHSPFIDRSSLPVGAPVEYVVLYYNAQGQVTAATPIVPVASGQLPTSTCVLGLS